MGVSLLIPVSVGLESRLVICNVYHCLRRCGVMRIDEMGFSYVAESVKNLGPVAGSSFINAPEAVFNFPMTAKQLGGCFAQIAVQESKIVQAQGLQKAEGQLPVNLTMHCRAPPWNKVWIAAKTYRNDRRFEEQANQRSKGS